MDQSNSQSSNQSDSLSKGSSYGGSDMSACEHDSQQYNILQARLDSLANEIKEAKDDHYQRSIDQLEVQLTETQDTDVRKQINDRIQMLTIMISNNIIRLNALYDERRQTREKLDEITARANRSRQSNKRKRRLQVINPSFIPSHTIFPTSFKPYSTQLFNDSYSTFFVDSMLYD